ncbi:hypothetical protein [Paenibacillus sp. FSL L8-0708]|uniref:hypothetical protein n=1 Tax=Paenibacillus sp. FSL L8-0708 TaxID=2975311 RepID=UPI0030F94D0C
MIKSQLLSAHDVASNMRLGIRRCRPVVFAGTMVFTSRLFAKSMVFSKWLFARRFTSRLCAKSMVFSNWLFAGRWCLLVGCVHRR